MSKLRSWIPKDDIRTLRSSNGAVWLCKECQHIIPFDAAYDNADARQSSTHNKPRHHNKYALLVTDVVPIGEPGQYDENGMKIRSEAELLAEFRASLTEKIILDESEWLDSIVFAEKYKDVNKSITYYMCNVCFKLAVCDALNIRRVYHCDKLATVHNKNFKQWFDSLPKPDNTEEEMNPFKMIEPK